MDPYLDQSSWHSPFKWLYLSEVHDRGGEVVGPAIVALGAGVPGSPIPAHNQQMYNSSFLSSFLKMLTLFNYMSVICHNLLVTYFVLYVGLMIYVSVKMNVLFTILYRNGGQNQSFHF